MPLPSVQRRIRGIRSGILHVSGYGHLDVDSEQVTAMDVYGSYRVAVKMKNTLDFKDNLLCIRHEDVGYDIPETIVLWWPIGRLPRADYDHLLGQEAIDNRDGIFRVQIGSCGSQRFMLENGGQTQAIAVERTPLPCPKVRKGIETRYRSGRWEKQLKTGWTSA